MQVATGASMGRQGRGSDRSGRLNPHRKRRAAQSHVAAAAAASRHSPGEPLPRGTVLFAVVDLNTPEERRVRADGSDRHAIKRRPVAVWRARENGDLEAVPLSTSLDPGVIAGEPVANHTVTTAAVLGQRHSLIHRILVLSAASVHWDGPCGSLVPEDLALLVRLVETGTVVDLRDLPRPPLPVRLDRRDPAAADRALAELRARRRRIVAALEGRPLEDVTSDRCT